MKTVVLRGCHQPIFGSMMILFLLSIGGCSKEGEPLPQPPAKSADNQITSFTFLLTKNPLDINVIASIDEEKKTITAVMPINTDISGLLPDIEIPLSAKVSPTTAQDFSTPVTYTVTAEDGSKAQYVVTVDVPLSQRQILQTILDANPENTTGWDLPNTADLGTLEGVSTDVDGNITILSLPGKNIHECNKEICLLTSLTSLELSFNSISSIPAEIGNLTQLEILLIPDNQITSIPPEIGNLKKLTGLSIAQNKLVSLPPEIGRLTKLEHFLAFKNNLTSLPKEVGQMTGLVVWRLEKNSLSTLPAEMSQLTNLIFLFVDENQLTSIPSEIGELNKLAKFSLSNNQLTSLPVEIGNMSNLVELVLNKNHLASLPPEMGFLKNLTTLNITDNPLTEIPVSICYMLYFKNMQVGFERDAGAVCSTISSLDALISIFATNPNNSLEWGVDNFPGVEFGSDGSPLAIEIQNKNIDQIYPSVAHLTSLRLLDVRNNPVTFFAPEVCKLQTNGGALTILADSGEGCN